jgi:hypothetical protein
MSGSASKDVGADPVVGDQGNLRFRVQEDGPRLPEDFRWVEVAAVVTDSRGRVSDHPVNLEQEGKRPGRHPKSLMLSLACLLSEPQLQMGNPG